MADRAAAERACKDPNPIIDGRKANVNLAYLGAKPRSLQTGESCFPSRLLSVSILSVGICWVEKGPPPPREWQSAIMCLQNCYRAVTPAWELSPLAVCGREGQDGEGTSPQLSAVLAGGSQPQGWRPGGQYREAAAPRGPGPASARCWEFMSGAGGGGLAGERKLVVLGMACVALPLSLWAWGHWPSLPSRSRLCCWRAAATPHTGPADLRVSQCRWLGGGDEAAVGFLSLKSWGNDSLQKYDYVLGEGGRKTGYISLSLAEATT